MVSHLHELQEKENMLFEKKASYTSSELLLEVLRSGKEIDPALLSLIARNYDADAKHIRELAAYKTKQLFKSHERAELLKLIRLIILVAYSLAFLYFSNGHINENMPLSIAVIGALSSGMKFRNLPMNNRVNRKLLTPSNK
jgi:hypothetical protein